MSGNPLTSTGRWIGAHWRRIAIGAAALLVVAFVVLAAFPWGVLKGQVEASLSRDLGRKVTIGSMRRADAFSLTPVIEVRDVVVPQPHWAKGPPMLRVSKMTARIDAIAMLLGGKALRALDVDGAQAELIRTAEKRTNWSNGKSGSGGGLSLPEELRIANTRVRYTDAEQDRAFDLTIAGETSGTLKVSGKGRLLDAPVTVSANGGSKGAGWPFDVHVSGNAIDVRARGNTAWPLALETMTASVEARAPDFAYLDALFEIGLPSTQPVTLKGRLRRDGDVWTIETLSGTVGRSDFSGQATLRKVGERQRIEGTLNARRFDFDDLASDAELAANDARNAKFGKHVVPATKIDLSTLGPTDGTLKLHADELLWPGSKPFRSLDLTLTREGPSVRIDPLRFGMPHGTLAGTATITQEKTGPRLRLALTLSGSRLTDLFPEAGIDAALRGKIDLTGTGTTVRSAISTSDGHMALVAEGGSLPDKTAILLGQDLGRSLFASKKKQAALNCVVARFDFHGGAAKANGVWIDTSRALSRVEGMIRLPDEALLLAVRGIPKQHVVLRFEDPVPVRGTIKAPDVGKPADANSFGDILGQIGEAIFGNDNVTTPDLNCKGVAAKALSF